MSLSSRRTPAGRSLDCQRELLQLHGVRILVGVVAETPGQIRALSAGLRDQGLHQRPASAEWPVAEQIGHLWDDEVLGVFRADTILAEAEPGPIGANQDRWNALPMPTLPVLLLAYHASWAASLVLHRGTPEGDWK